MKSSAMIPLGDLIAQKSGSINPAKFSDEVFDLYSIPAFDAAQPEICAGKEIGSAKQAVQPNDVLLSRIVPHIRRAWVVGENRGRRLIASGEWIVFRNSQSNSRYLRYFLVSNKFHTQFMQTVSGVGGSLLRASAKEVAKIQVLLPALAQQERLVKLLDEADALRKLRTQADRRTVDLIPALFHEWFGDIESGNGKQLGELCLKITDGAHVTPTYVGDGVPFLRVTDIHKPEIDWNNVKRIPQHEYEKMTRRVKPEKGDVLYSKNGTIGIAKEISWERPFSHFVSLALLKPKRDLLNPTFLTTYLNTPIALRQAVGHSKTGTVTNLHLNEIRKIRIPCPPLEMQDDFVDRVMKIRTLEAGQAASRRRLDDLFQAMLHRVFSGEL